MIKTLIVFLFCTAIFNAQNLTIYNKSNSSLLSNNVSSLFIDANNTKWFGTKKGLSLLYDNLSWDSLKTDDGLASNIITDITSDISRTDSNFIEVATLGGISKLNISAEKIVVLQPVTKENSELISNDLRSLSINSSGIHWFATSSGASSFDGTNWNNFSKENFWLISNDITDIASRSNHYTYLATSSDGVSRIKQDVDGISSASEITKEWSGLASDSVHTLFINKLGRRWYGTTKGVSMHFGDKTKENWITYNSDDGLIENNVTAICEDSVGTMWFGTEAGLSSFDGTVWKSYTTSNGLSGNIIYDLAVDINGNIWIATNNGITYLDKVTSIKSEQFVKASSKLSLSTYPNPFNMQVQIDFSIINRGAVELKIYDIRGKEIFNFYEQELSEGNYSVTWNGTDSKNNTVSSGIYICQLISNNQRVSQKLLLMK